MGLEIERKFLVTSDTYKTMAVARHHIVQGYLSTRAEATVRVRILDDKGYITVKTANRWATRGEWEYEIPIADARQLIKLHDPSTRLIDKTRHIIPTDKGLKWEVDEFHGVHAPLVVAEIELPDVDTPFQKPEFVDREVTGDPRYYNSVLAGLL